MTERPELEQIQHRVPPREASLPRSLANLDLNLLITLDAVLGHQNATRAAEQLGVTQPAISAALRRLRRYFDDDLLRRVGNRFELTPLAVDIRQHTRLALESVGRVFSIRNHVDVSLTRREFSVVTSDYSMALLGESLTANLLEQAPHARLRLVPDAPDHLSQAEQILAALDVMLVTHDVGKSLSSEELFRDEWVIVMDRNHPSAAGGPSIDDLRSLPWVLVHHSQTEATPITQQLRRRGIERWVQVTTDSYLTVPPLVAGSNRLAVLPSRLFDTTVGGRGLVCRSFPLPLAPLVHRMWWHPVHNFNPQHQFFRQVVVSAARAVGGGQGVCGSTASI
ncbi:LysR substrate-binding domain-containing protein [Rhodococcus koreensis]